jgi:hypothetical protein
MNSEEKCELVSTRFGSFIPLFIEVSHDSTPFHRAVHESDANPRIKPH